jgi:spermidine synthase
MALSFPSWFCEISAQWPGQAFCLKVKEVLLEQRSDFQDVLVSRHGHSLLWLLASQALPV